MSGAELLAVVGCVAAVISAYNDGSELVKKVRERRRSKRALQNAAAPDSPTHDLELSLESGKTSVSHQYDRHYRRMGDPFATGDQEARDTLKDIIIHLQAQVISNLKIAWQHDTAVVDFVPLQDVSDDSQNRAIICLMHLQQRLLVAAPITEITYTSQPPRQNIPHGFIETPSRHESWASQSSMQSPTRTSTTPTEIMNGGSAGFGSIFKPHPGTRTLQYPVEGLSRASTATIEVDNKKRGFFAGVFGKQKTIHEIPQTPAVDLPHGAVRVIPPAIPPKDDPPNGAPNAGLGFNLPQQEVPQLVPSRVSSVSTMSSSLPEAERQETDPFYDPWKGAPSPREEYSDSRPNSCTFRPPFGPDTIPGHTSALGHRTSTSSGHSWASRDNPSSHRSSQSSTLSWSPSATAPLTVTKRPTLASISEPHRLSAVSVASGSSWLSRDSISNHRTSQVSELSWVDPASSAPEVDQRAQQSSVSAPEVIPQPRQTSISAPEVVQRPRQASVSAPEVVPRPRQPSYSAPEVYQLASVSTPTQRLSTVSSFSTGSSVRQPNSPNMHETVRNGLGRSKGNLPSEDNNFAGFCKGAWRLQIGDSKKAIEEIMRPGSMYAMSSFWKCKRCNFEGRMTKDAKGKKSIDTRVYGSNGILYRWAFLFKSHVCLKDAMSSPMDSTFGCIFCCAEGHGTPIFGGVKSFLAHMQEHREREPAGEVLYRMSCVVGKTPRMEDEFEIALPPVTMM